LREYREREPERGPHAAGVVLLGLEIGRAGGEVERERLGDQPPPASEDPVRAGLTAGDVLAVAEILVRVARAGADLMLERELVQRVRAARRRPHPRAIVARAVEER